MTKGGAAPGPAEAEEDEADCSAGGMAKGNGNPFAFIAQPCQKGRIDNVDAFQKIAPIPQRLQGGGRIGFQIGGYTQQVNGITVGLHLLCR